MKLAIILVSLLTPFFLCCAESDEVDVSDYIVKVYKLPYNFRDLLIDRLSEDRRKHRGFISLVRLEGIVFKKGSNAVWTPQKEVPPYSILILFNKPTEIRKMDQVIKEMKVKMEDLTSEYLENGKIILPDTNKQNKRVERTTYPALSQNLNENLNP